MEKQLNVLTINRIRTKTDGEGVTTLVVSMGCPLRCAYCINPMTWDGSYKASKKYTVDALYDELKIDNLYFLATGGGVMFGGGEPLLNIDFISEFINKYKDTGWKFNMETSLSVPLESLQKSYGLIDCYYVDTKDMNKERYELYTKGDYDLFYSNLKNLLENVGPDHILCRVPIIPKLHKNEEYKENVEALQKMGIKSIEVFNYIIPENRKQISDNAKNNMNDFIHSLDEAVAWAKKAGYKEEDISNIIKTYRKNKK